MPRTGGSLSIYDGRTRSFEWYWDGSGEMPALDAYEALDEDDQDAVMASIEYWGDLEQGKRTSETRVNRENDDPPIYAIKAGAHRFSAFHAGDDTWIICDYYKKQKRKLDKIGKASIKRTVRAKTDYEHRVKEGMYYERA
jgi:hypothetical protein